MAQKTPTMKFTLAQLLSGVELAKAADIQVGGLALDSRKVNAGDVFFALVGAQIDGRNFIASAIERGAAAILVEADKEWQGLGWLGDVPVIAVEQLSRLVSQIAARFYQNPSEHIAITGITGTNGKTTCSLLLGQVYALLSGRGAVLGTVGCGVLDSSSLAPLAQQIAALQTTGLTTPDPISVQHILAQLREQGATFAAMEVSSHSLVQARVAAVQFDCAVFTNLTQDHLDFHGDLASYGKAKQQLLLMPGLRYAVMNADDAWANSLLAQAPASVQALSYSLSDNSADIYVKNLQLTAAGAIAEVVTPWGEAELRSHFLGRFNIGNLLAVIAGACVQGLPFLEVIKTIEQLQPAPGRMQAVAIEQSEQDISVIVDYAHTPDALENTLNALHEHKPGRIWTVFGCGGDRDKTKRPLMGRIAERLSDYVIITNDNPRTEDPAAIAADILRGMHNTHGCLVIADRAQAIDLAVQQAKAGDIVLIAGKGHEDYQIFAAQTLPFSDVKQARLSLQRRLAKRDSAEVSS